MRFNLIFDFHKKPHWRDFYFEYNELKEYLKTARSFFNEQVDNQCKKHPENIALRKIKLEEEKNGEVEINNGNGDNHINNHKYEKAIVLNEHIFTSQTIFTTKYIKNFKSKLQKVEDFFFEVKNDLITDYEHLKHLVLECEDVEKFGNVNVLKNLLSIKHDYQWRESKEGDEITCRLAFIHLYRLAILLENYSVINKLAAQKIIDKYKKSYPDDKKTIEDLNNLLNNFYTVISLEENFKNDILEFYSKQFFGGNVVTAKNEFYRREKQSVSEYSCIIVQIIVVILLIVGFILLTVLVPKNYFFTTELINVFFPAFSFSLMVILFFIYSAIILAILKHYSVNYIYLLELDPELLYSPLFLLKHFLSLLIIWEIVFILYRICLSYFYEIFKTKLYIFSVIILCLLFIFAFWPFTGLLSKLRICLIIIVIKCLFPVTRKGVKFRDFIFADILTSYAMALANLTVAFCILYCKECRENNNQGQCHMNPIIPVAVFFPVLIRILQCINLIYYGQRRKIEIVNTIKYLVHGSDLVLGWLYGKQILDRTAYILIVVFSSTFLLSFDMIIDWNVWHLKSKNFLLRDKLVYPKWFYYYAMITNGLLRYFWFTSLVLPLKKDWIVLIANFLEIYRRAQWTLIRLENEELYNLEGYRMYLPIPKMPLH